MSEQLAPLDAAWAAVTFLGPVIWWSKAIAAAVVGLVLQLLPQPVHRRDAQRGLAPVEWHAVIWSRAGVLIGAMLLMLSVLTPINAFGPLGDLVFFPSMGVNAVCLLWCNRATVFAHLRTNRPAEISYLRSFFIAGVPSQPRD